MNDPGFLQEGELREIIGVINAFSDSHGSDKLCYEITMTDVNGEPVGVVKVVKDESYAFVPTGWTP